MPSSILDGVKVSLGLDPTAIGFDPELIIFINAVLADFNQLGLGPNEGFAIEDRTDTWEEYFADVLTDAQQLRLNGAKELLFLRVKMLFDPPQVGYVLTSYEKMIEKAEWRLNVQREEIVHPSTETIYVDHSIVV